MNRRHFVQASMMAGAALVFRPVLSWSSNTNNMARAFAALEHKQGGRLGVAVVDTASGQGATYRAGERFLMCSTFKLLLVAAVLKRVEQGKERLARRVVFDEDAVLDWAPVTQLNVGAPGMPIQALCEAALLMSDNTAANLLLDTIGGPHGMTAYARSLGDDITRLDHNEPLNNDSTSDKDTTTPAAMLADMQAILVGDVLHETSREMLLRWLALNQTGTQSLRAGVPADWRVGDKTGAASNANNDIAIAWPSGRKPVLITAYYMNDAVDTSHRKAVLARVGQIVASSVG